MAAGRGRTGAFLCGAVLLILGERALTGIPAARSGVAAVAVLLMLVSFGLRLRSWLAGREALRPVEARLSVLHALGLVAAALYGLSLPWAHDALGVPTPLAGERDLLGAALAVAWPIVGLVSVLPMALLDLAASPMRRAGATDLRRAGDALRSGLSLALALGFLFVFNFLCTRHDKSWDLAYFRTARPGTATKAMVERLEQPVNAVLFYPRANDVKERVQAYFEELSAHSDNLRLKVADRLLHPKLAREHGVRKDGVVVLARGEKRESWELGTEMGTARRKLSRLDEEVNKRLSKVVVADRVAYLSVGHGEINDTFRPNSTRPARTADTFLRRVLKWQGYQARDLGLKEGLGTLIPDDAAVVLVLGPKQALLEEEQDSLARYLRAGGRVLLAAHHEGEAAPAKLLEALGLKIGEHALCHERYHMRRRFDLSDREILVTNSFSSHPSVRTLSYGSRQLALLLDGAADLDKSSQSTAPEGTRTDFCVRSMPSTWADKDGDRKHDPQTEKKEVLQLAAAVTMPALASLPTPPAPDGESADKPEPAEGRAFVVADAEVFADPLMQTRGNLLLLSDALRFLQGEEHTAGTIESEEDKPVKHTREDDVVWFYATVFLIPFAVLGGGLGYVHRRRRRRA